MASWIAHLNVADKIAEHLKLDLVFFAAGNIAPDCGEKVAERVFVPDTLTTHFTKTDKDACDYEAFFEKYILRETNPERRSFFAGYYTHLYTDVLWTRLIVKQQKKKYASLLREKGEREFYRKMKGDWYGLDFQFLKEHPDMRMWRSFCSINEFPNTFLPFYSEAAFTNKFRQIREFYRAVSETHPRQFRYMQPSEWEDFADKAAATTTAELKNKGFEVL